MTNAVRHRGPDDEGQWIDDEHGIALGHRRLSIIDLSPEGRQPMVSASGQFVLTFNGEIYNFQELRRLEAVHGARWRGHSDTEVLLTLIERRGLHEALQRTVGMFALALWDRVAGTLSLARDRLGEKPLYYGRQGDVLVFASELKALRAYPGFSGELDRSAIALFLRHGYIPAPLSIYRDIRKLEPGKIALFRTSDAAPHICSYWSAQEAAAAGLAAAFEGGASDYVDALERQMHATVADQMTADVPVGAFLSGGIDSSLVVALMQQHSSRAVRTFTVGFEEAEWNEAHHARAISRHLGTDHTELTLTPQDLLAVVPRLPSVYDEPFSDSSQVPTILVAALARQGVTVSLSGDGGDELFGGYARYALGERMWTMMRRVPSSMRRMTARAVGMVPAAAWDRVLQPLGAPMPAGFHGRVNGDRVQKVASLIAHESFERFYRDLVSHWRAPADVLPGAVEPATILTTPSLWLSSATPLARMMYLDGVSYLPDDILVKVDRATMAVGLESRAPFLDHRVYELAWRMPPAVRTTLDGGKSALKMLLARYVPSTLTSRPKAGFSMPIAEWLRGPLREWGDDLLSARRIREDGLLDPEPVRKKWEEHQSRARDWQQLLWDVLVLQAWVAASRVRDPATLMP